MRVFKQLIKTKRKLKGLKTGKYKSTIYSAKRPKKKMEGKVRAIPQYRKLTSRWRI